MSIALFYAARASAQVEPGNIPADTIQTAYPIQSGVTYHGAFQPDTKTGYHDLDYLRFTVASAGETLRFTLQNTTTGITPNTCDAWCPVFLSILNQSNTLVADGAGTIATYADTEVFDWTFQTPGTYYLVMESDGDLPPGLPSYAVSFNAPGAAVPSPPLVRSLHISQSQTGPRVNASVTFGQEARAMELTLLYGKHPKSIAELKRGSLGPGRHKFKLALPTKYRTLLNARRKLFLSVRIKVTGSSGLSETFNRRVTLTA
jgi:hypothetical protein